MTQILALVRGILERPIVRGFRLRTIDLVLLTWFTALTTDGIVRPIFEGLKAPLGMDAVVYTHAARELLSGGNPWRVQVYDIAFAAPPPSLLPYLLLAPIPDLLVAALGVVVAFLSAVYAIRRLGLPLWWLLFPPVAIGIAAGSSTLPVLALLVRGGVIAEAAGIVQRVYAGLPMAALDRWRGLVLAGIVIVATAPFLGWATYVSDFDHVSRILSLQSAGGHSAAAIPLLVPVAGVLLLLLGRRRAAWLLVPVLWPDSQLHYSSIALPIIAEVPMVAIVLAFPLTPAMVVIGLAGQVLAERLSRWIGRAGAQGHPAGQVPQRSGAPD